MALALRLSYSTYLFFFKIKDFLHVFFARATLTVPLAANGGCGTKNSKPMRGCHTTLLSCRETKLQKLIARGIMVYFTRTRKARSPSSPFSCPAREHDASSTGSSIEGSGARRRWPFCEERSRASVDGKANVDALRPLSPSPRAAYGAFVFSGQQSSLPEPPFRI